MGNQTEPYDPILFSCIFLALHGDGEVSEEEANMLSKIAQSLHDKEGQEVLENTIIVFNRMNVEERTEVVMESAKRSFDQKPEIQQFIASMLGQVAIANNEITDAEEAILSWFGVSLKPQERTENEGNEQVKKQVKKPKSKKEKPFVEDKSVEIKKAGKRTELNNLSDYLNHRKNNFSGKKFDVVKLLIEHLENTIRKEFPSVIFKYSPSGISIYADAGGRSKFAGIFINKALAQIVLIRDHRHEYRKPIINGIKAINRVNDLGWIDWYKLELSSTNEFEKSKEQVIQLFRESLDMKVKFPAKILKEKTFTAKKASLLSKYLGPDYTYVVEREATAEKEPNAEQNKMKKFTLWFYAWIGEKNEIDTENPTEYFEKTFATIEDAKDFFYNDCIKWDEGEWDGSWITISFKKPPVIECDGLVISVCRITDWEDYEFEWFDKTGDSEDKVDELTDEKGYPTLKINLLNKPTIDKRRKQYTGKWIEPSVFFNLRDIKVNIPSWLDQFDNDNCCPGWSQPILDKISSTIEKKKIIPILEYVPKILFDHLEQPWWICPLAVFNAQGASALIVSNSGIHSLVPGDDDITWIHGWDQVRKMELTESFNNEENLVCLEIIDPDNEKLSIVEFVKQGRGSYLKVLYSIYNVFRPVIEASEGKDSWQYYAGNETYMGFESVGELENDLGK